MFASSTMSTPATTTRPSTSETISMSLQVCWTAVVRVNMASKQYVFTIMCLCVRSGMADLDYGLYPSREMQMDWLKVYLQAYKLFTKKTEEVSQRELETLYVQVNKFALVRRNMLLKTHCLWHGHTQSVSRYFNLISDLCLLRLLTSFGASGRSSRPNTPPSTLTSSGKLQCECVKALGLCVAAPCAWYHISDSLKRFCQRGVKQGIIKDWNQKPKKPTCLSFLLWASITTNTSCSHTCNTHGHQVCPPLVVHREEVDLRRVMDGNLISPASLTERQR